MPVALQLRLGPQAKSSSPTQLKKIVPKSAYQQREGERVRVVVVAISSANFHPICLYRRVWGRGLSNYFAKQCVHPKLRVTKVAGPGTRVAQALTYYF
jgi:hypothetical protein